MCENILKNNVPCEKLQDTSAKNSSRMSSTASTLNVCLSTESYGCKSISVDEERKQRIIDSDWGGYALDLDLWEDSKSPVIQVRSNEISFDNKECCGFLSDRLIGTGLSFLTRSPESGLYVLSKCVLKNKNLTDVTMLQYHHHLQYVTSAMLFASPLDLTAARKVAKLMLLEQLNISKMDDHIQPYDEIYPPLVILTGPAALKKMALILHIAQTIPEKIKYCRWHTTKEMCEDDDELNAHILINREEFNDLARRGEFLVILDRLGESYGFHTNQISPLISENKIGLTQMNLYAVTEMSKRYPNAQPILVLTQSVDLHRDWIREKFNVHTWIKDSVEDLLVVKRSKHPEDMEVETASCILHFVEEILDEIMHRLEFPSYSISIKPQNGATSTNVILTSKKMLPKVVIQRSELILREKECIKPKKTKINGDLVKFDRLLAEEKQARKELKVLLDEDSNIIIDDKETKREMLRSRMLRRRHSLIKNRLNDFDNSELSESVSSEEETEIRQEKIMHKKARALKNTYVELVLKTRQMYLDYHESHPGFFTSVLVMDDYAEAFNSLSDLINELYTSQSYRKPIFLSEIEHFRQTKISIALENIVNEIRGNLSTSKLQHSTILKM
ncbi:uncharacterized protein LOC114928478 isoform X1 [Nylanderia fulva]|uniref:uncharacterized protein LOC114928478 isoform X1 n=1 Tax=Nylanderia fulva TaxID=613905 RepID=UPI0010FAF86D|nr:uncharacterized protein LOC114928478 isoform X1 [Nylanderia fulva]